ncbi:MAG: Fe-S cluster assembly protein SufD [Legionellaceae bacterium]|nr:Fe-S cluster assembly protein SufD [Legionellaceae bacterium]
MSECTDFYQQQAQRLVSATDWLASLQKDALTDFVQLGFPSRDDEDWKYTSTDSFLKQSFVQPPASEHLDKHAVAVVATGRQTDAPVGMKIALVNGVVIALDSLAKSLPPGVIVQPLNQAIHEHPEKIKPYLGKILQHEHGFQALNTAMLGFGLFIYVPQNVCLAEPLLLTHWQTTADQATFLRHVIVAETGSSLCVIEDYQGEATSSYFTNTMTEVYAAPQAKVTHYKIQRESKLAYHVGHIAVKQAASSQFDSHLVSLGGQWSRSDVTIHLSESNARCLLNGIYATADGQHMDHHTLINHTVPDCFSEQDYKGILTGHSRAVFNGKVFVAQKAQRTQAKQQNKNLLLSKTAEIDTKPQLDIYADDVTCTHGATVGQLDEEALFYFATRGIDAAEASRYLIQAFAASNLQAINHSPLSSWMSGLLSHQIG